MDLSGAILASGAGALVIGLVYLLFGYKLARFLLPLCGTLVTLVSLWAFMLPVLHLNAMETWLFMGGAGVSVYILLLFFKRVAGFFAGVLGAALLLLYTVYALNLTAVPFLVPVCFALCAVSGLLALVYKKAGVIVFTSILGACIAVFAGLFLYFEGVNPDAFSGNVLTPLAGFLTDCRYLIAGGSLIASVAGILVQGLVTGKNQVLPGPLREERNKPIPQETDSAGPSF